MDEVKSSSPYFAKEELEAVLKDIRQMLLGGVLTEGPHVKLFEKEFGTYVQARHAIAVNSGTAALEIALRHFKPEGGEVIVPTNTFVATPNTVIFAGGKPVFADIRADTLCLDPDDVRRRINRNTVGIVVVHIAGLVCPQIRELMELCRENDLFLIEDAAHAHGAKAEGKMAGTLSDCGCFSFFPTKVMTTGEGGMIVTEDDALADEAHVIRSHGQNERRLMVALGHNWRMSEVAAIIGRHQLRSLNSFVERRNQIAESYNRHLANVGGLEIFRTPPRFRHSYYKYPVRVGDEVDRDGLAQVLRNEYGVETGTVYDPPCHLHPFYMRNFGTRMGDFPVSERVLRKVLCLPMHVGMDEKSVDRVVRSLDESMVRPEIARRT